MTEVWLPVVGYEGFYEVSRCGSVRSRRGPLTPVMDVYGYATVKLHRPGHARRFPIHRLVCTAFNGPPTILHTEVGHLDGTRTNNHASNLRWVSKAENAHHRRWHGTHPGGANHPRAKLTEEAVHRIRRLIAAGSNCTEIGREFGVHNTTIQDIKRGRKWRSLEHESPAPKGDAR